MTLLGYLRKRPLRPLLVSTIAGALSGAASAAVPALIHRALGATAETGPPLGLTYFGLCAVLLAGKLIAEITLLRVTQRAIAELRVSLSEKLLATPFERLQALGKHRLLAILTEDVSTFTHALEWVPILLVNAVVVIGCFGYLCWLSAGVTALLVVVLGVGMGLFHLAERRPLAHLERAREQTDALYGQFRNLIEGSRELQLNAARGRAFLSRVVAPSAHEFERRFVRGMSSYTAVASAGMMIFYVAIGAALFALPPALRPEASMLTGFVVTLLYVIRPVVEVMMALPSLRQAEISLRRIHQLAAELDAAPAAPATLPAELKVHRRLELRAVEHHYAAEQGDPFVLGPIDLRVRGGELVFIVGGNGSGKTTLAMVLLGLYTPAAGVIELDGRPISDADREHYRQQFSAVFSDFHLFEQLLDIDSPALVERARHYVRAFGLGHKVTVEDGRFSTIALSAGQRKRLALVCAYLEDRPFYVFDEWAADQDPAFRRIFYTQVLPELKARGKAVIVITHDDAYFGCADRVIALDRGQLCAAEGSARIPNDDTTAHVNSGVHRWS